MQSTIKEKIMIGFCWLFGFFCIYIIYMSSHYPFYLNSSNEYPTINRTSWDKSLLNTNNPMSPLHPMWKN